MAKKRSKTQAQNINGRFNRLSSAQLFYINSALLATSLVLLGLALWVQNSEKNPVVPFSGYSKGVTVTMGSASVKVDKIETSKGAGRFKAPDGTHYLIVNLTVKNTSDKPINVLPSTDTYVKSPAGKVTVLTPYSLSNPFRAGELLPGEQISGQLSYLVPENGAQKLYIDASWSGGVIPIELQ